jgi:hypothetical protein
MGISNKQYDTMVSGLRSYLRGLSTRRTNGVVTADDAQNFLTRKGIRPQQVRTRQSMINAAFLSGDFTSVGSTASSRPEAKGRSITEWMTV